MSDPRYDERLTFMLAVRKESLMGHPIRLHSALISLVALSALACGPCPDGSEPSDDCVCNDTEKTKLSADECAVAGEDSGAGAASGSAATSGTEGDDNRGGTSGAGTASSEPLVVYDDEPPTGEWERDSAAGDRDGGTAAHPPTLGPGDERSMDFDCGGEEHTQLSFQVTELRGGAEFELLVDGISRGIVPIDGYWRTKVINVDLDAHEYTLIARSKANVKIDPPFVVDAFMCKLNPPAPGHNMFVNYDDAFIPPELGAGWFVDNLHGSEQGEAAVRPPHIEAGDDISMTFDCDDQVHTQLRFKVTELRGGAELELFDGEVSRGLIPTDGYWRERVVNVQQGRHRYTFTARSLSNTQITSPFVLDTFACKNVDPTSGAGFINFDQGFIPSETGGDWVVDNFVGTQAGDAAVHPPTLSPEGESALSFDCGKDSAAVSFFVTEIRGGAELELFDGEESRGLVPTDGYWREQTFNLDSPRDFSLVARSLSATDVTPPFALDTFSCQ